MSTSSSVPAIVFSDAGLTLPAESEILAGVLADMNEAFGGNMNLSLTTPQGQLATSQAASIAAKNSQIAFYLNQIDPATASGRMQDAIGRLYFLDRLPATATVVQVDCLGLAGVVIPAGSLVSDVNGQKYASTVAATIPGTGTVTVPFAATVTGPISCPIGAIVSISRTIAGWDRASNDTAGIPGTDVESRADFESRRKQSVAVNAVGTLPSIYAAAFGVDGVLDVYVAENYTDTAAVVGGVSLLPHSVYVAVVGGAPLDVATAIWKKKSVGGNWNGNTSVQAQDTSGYQPPYPVYTVKYQTPASLPILVAVTLAASAALPANIVALVRAAIMSAFVGGDGGTRARIGATIYASRYYAPVATTAAGVQIVSIMIGTTTATLSAVTSRIDQVPTLSAANISVTLV